jgi:peptide deformylase
MITILNSRAEYYIEVLKSHRFPRPPSRPRRADAVNPPPRHDWGTIIARSDELVKDGEGCLRIPGLRGLVPAVAASARYQTVEGQTVRRESGDVVARIWPGGTRAGWWDCSSE